MLLLYVRARVSLLRIYTWPTYLEDLARNWRWGGERKKTEWETREKNTKTHDHAMATDSPPRQSFFSPLTYPRRAWFIIYKRFHALPFPSRHLSCSPVYVRRRSWVFSNHRIINVSCYFRITGITKFHEREEWKIFFFFLLYDPIFYGFALTRLSGYVCLISVSRNEIIESDRMVWSLVEKKNLILLCNGSRPFWRRDPL